MSAFKAAHEERRREEAEARQAQREARSDEEQLHLLVNRGHGHCAEAERLRQTITEASS